MKMENVELSVSSLLSFRRAGCKWLGALFHNNVCSLKEVYSVEFILQKNIEVVIVGGI